MKLFIKTFKLIGFVFLGVLFLPCILFIGSIIDDNYNSYIKNNQVLQEYVKMNKLDTVNKGHIKSKQHQQLSISKKREIIRDICDEQRTSVNYILKYPEDHPTELKEFARDYKHITENLCDCAFKNSYINTCISDEDLYKIVNRISYARKRYKGE